MGTPSRHSWAADDVPKSIREDLFGVLPAHPSVARQLKDVLDAIKFSFEIQLRPDKRLEFIIHDSNSEGASAEVLVDPSSALLYVVAGATVPEVSRAAVIDKMTELNWRRLYGNWEIDPVMGRLRYKYCLAAAHSAHPPNISTCLRKLIAMMWTTFAQDQVVIKEIIKQAPSNRLTLAQAIYWDHLAAAQAKADIATTECITEKIGLGGLPLTVASGKGFTSVVTALLSRGADPEAQDMMGRNAFMVALYEGQVATARVLRSKVDVNALDKHGHSALSLACCRGHVEAVRFLVEECEAEKSGNDLAGAAANGHAEIVSLLVNANIDPDSKDAHGQTALQTARDAGQVHVIEILIEAGAETKERDSTSSLTRGDGRRRSSNSAPRTRQRQST